MVNGVDNRNNQPAATPPPPQKPKTADPVPNWRDHITSRPGNRASPGGIGSTNHEGLDIAVPTGTPVQAAKEGKVVFAGAAGGYGNLVVIQHDDGTFTKYAHQSQINVQVGQDVKAGDVVGKSGSTGNSTGPHLHFEVRKGDWNNGAVLDPVAYLEGSESVAAADPGPGRSFSSGPSNNPGGVDNRAVGGGTSSSGLSLPGAGSGGSQSSSAGSANTAPPAGGTAVPAGDFGALLAKLAALGLSKAYLEELARKYGVPLELLLGVIMQESGGNPNAQSGAGAQGLMQLMPATAKGLGVGNPFDPKENVEGGAKMLGQLLQKYGGDTTKVLAAYNAGPGNVDKYGGVPPFSETQQYVANITTSLDNARQALA